MLQTINELRLKEKIKKTFSATHQDSVLQGMQIPKAKF